MGARSNDSVYGYRLRKRAYGTHFRRHYRFIKESQYYSKDEIFEYQSVSLRDLIKFSFENSKFWRNTLDRAGVSPDGIRRPVDLANLPILEKETVRSKIGQIQITDEFGKVNLIPVHTSGTTGKALHLYLTREVREREYAFRELHRNWGGIHRGSRVATMAGHPVVPPASMKPPF